MRTRSYSQPRVCKQKSSDACLCLRAWEMQVLLGVVFITLSIAVPALLYDTFVCVCVRACACACACVYQRA